MLEEFYNIILKVGNYKSLFDNFIYIDFNKKLLVNSNNKKEYNYSDKEEIIIKNCLKDILYSEIVIFLNDKKNEEEQKEKILKSYKIKNRKLKQQLYFNENYNKFYK